MILYLVTFLGIGCASSEETSRLNNVPTKIYTMAIAIGQLESPDLDTQIFSGLPENYLRLLFPDRTYNSWSQLTSLKVHLIEKLSRRNNPFQRIVLDVVSEFKEIVEKEMISHLVIYGKNRVPVLISIVCCGDIPQSMPILLSKKKIIREELTTQQLPYTNIKSFPKFLDNPEFYPVLSPILAKQLYSTKELFNPYQIDTERYPFTNKF